MPWVTSQAANKAEGDEEEPIDLGTEFVGLQGQERLGGAVLYRDGSAL